MYGIGVDIDIDRRSGDLSSFGPVFQHWHGSERKAQVDRGVQSTRATRVKW